MLSENTIVVSLDEDCLQLKTQRQASCSGCSMKSGCGQYLLSGDRDVLSFRDPALLASLRQDGVVPGEELKLGLEPAQLLRLSLWFYVLPLAGLLSGTLLAMLLGSSEALTALAAAAGLGLGVSASRRILRRADISKNIGPHIGRADRDSGGPENRGSEENRKDRKKEKQV